MLAIPVASIHFQTFLSSPVANIAPFYLVRIALTTRLIDTKDHL